MTGWWTKTVEVLRWFPRAFRSGRRMGQVFRLRDRGRLEEALEKGLALAEDLLATPADSIDAPMAMVAVSTVAEIAGRLGRPQAAEAVLRRGLAFIERERTETMPTIPRKPRDYRSLLDSFERQFKDRLATL
jgi:hypothetical protein